jgi:hypothetical protein
LSAFAFTATVKNLPRFFAHLRQADGGFRFPANGVAIIQTPGIW